MYEIRKILKDGTSSIYFTHLHTYASYKKTISYNFFQSLSVICSGIMIITPQNSFQN